MFLFFASDINVQIVLISSATCILLFVPYFDWSIIRTVKFILFVLSFLGPLPWDMEVPGLYRSHCNARSEACLRPTSQLTAL